MDMDNMDMTHLTLEPEVDNIDMAHLTLMPVAKIVGSVTRVCLG